MSETCVSCGGRLGVDCFNPQECAEITRDMAAQDGRFDALARIAELEAGQVIRCKACNYEVQRDAMVEGGLVPCEYCSLRHWNRKLEDERDALLIDCGVYRCKSDINYESWVKAQSERDKLRDALTQIKETFFDFNLSTKEANKQIFDTARAALEEAH